MPAVSPDLELEDVLSAAKFSETHRRTIRAPIEEVWAAVHEVTAAEIRFFGPLMKLRHNPARFRHGRRPKFDEPSRSVIEQFVDAGFLLLRDDHVPADGRCCIVLAAAAKFWLPDHSEAAKLTGLQDFVAFSEPGFGRTVLCFEALERGDATDLVTRTFVGGTDRAAERRLRIYWTAIRLPSGLMRRNWLAAIDRRARRDSS